MGDSGECDICYNLFSEGHGRSTLCSNDHISCRDCHLKIITTPNSYGGPVRSCPMCRGDLRVLSGRNMVIAHQRAAPRCSVCRQEGHNRRGCTQATPEMIVAWDIQVAQRKEAKRLRDLAQTPDFIGPLESHLTHTPVHRDRYNPARHHLSTDPGHAERQAEYRRQREIHASDQSRVRFDEIRRRREREDLTESAQRMPDDLLGGQELVVGDLSYFENGSAMPDETEMHNTMSIIAAQVDRIGEMLRSQREHRTGLAEQLLAAMIDDEDGIREINS